MSSCFIKSPLNLWFKDHDPQESLLICSPFFKNFALDELISAYRLADDNRSINIKVLIRGKLEDFLSGSSDISALESLIQLRNVDITQIKRITNLHMKAYLIDNTSLLVGSGNFTRSGLYASSNIGNVEGAIASNNDKVISDFIEYFNEIEQAGESLDVFYDTVTEDYQSYVDKYASNLESQIAALKIKGEAKSKYRFKTDNLNAAQRRYVKNITVQLIPQFSKFNDGAYKVVELLKEDGNTGLTFNELGILLQGDKGEVANKKYGENHSKLAELLDLVTITHTSPRKIYLTKLGETFCNLSNSRKTNILKQQILRMPLVQDIIIEHLKDDFNLKGYLISLGLSNTTAVRRSPNVKKLFQFLKEQNVNELDSVIDKLS